VSMLYIFLGVANLLLIAAIYRNNRQLGRSRPLAERCDWMLARLPGWRRTQPGDTGTAP
jgi:hypothetical protein